MPAFGVRDLSAIAVCAALMLAPGVPGLAQAQASSPSLPRAYVSASTKLPARSLIEFRDMVKVGLAPNYEYGVPIQRISAGTIIEWTRTDVVFVLAPRGKAESDCHVSAFLAYPWADDERRKSPTGHSSQLLHLSDALCDGLRLRLDEDIFLSAALARLTLLVKFNRREYVPWLVASWPKLHQWAVHPDSQMDSATMPSNAAASPLLKEVQKIIRQACKENDRLRDVRRILMLSDIVVPPCS